MGSDSRVTERTVIKRLPQPIASAWWRVRRAVVDSDRLLRLPGAFEVTLRTLLAILIPDYLRGPREEGVEVRIRKLTKPSLGDYAWLVHDAAAAIGARRSPAPFLAEATGWLRDAAGRPTPAARSLWELVELRNRLAHDGAPLSPSDVHERVVTFHGRLRDFLASLDWLAGYRIFRVLTQTPTRRGTTRGHVQFFVGHEEGEPAPAEWRGRLLPDTVYLLGPAADGALEISPFLAVLGDGKTPVERCFLLRSTPKLKRLVMVADETEATIRDHSCPSASGELPFDAWLEGREDRQPLAPLEDVSGALGESPADPCAPSGERLAGRYEVLGVLGEGGMGVVYHVYDTSFDEEVALKVLKPALVGDPVVADRFRREAATMRKARHPDILSILDVGELEAADGADGAPYIKLPLVSGGSLRDRVRTGARSDAEVVASLLPMLRALAHLHALGIIHRDVKPSNFLIATDGRPLLSDFGIALGPEQDRLTRTLEQVGSIAYMAPERRVGRPETPAVDVYSLAVVTHELISGRLPAGAPGAGFGGPLGALVRRMGLDDPMARPSAAAALREVEALASREPGDHPVRAAAAERACGVSLDSSAVQRSPGASGARRPFLVVLALVTLGSALAVLLSLWEDDRPPPRKYVEVTDAGATTDSESADEADVVSDAPTSEIPQGTPDSAICTLGGAPTSKVPAGWTRFEPGEFVMGSPPQEPGRDPDEGKHQVRISHAFLVQQTEVTQAQWAHVMGERPSPWHFRKCGSRCPVESVNWWEALAFCNRLSEREGLAQCYVLAGCDSRRPGEGMRCGGARLPEGVACEGYRVPTEAEWEYAARAGATGAIPIGRSPTKYRYDYHSPELDPIARFGGNSGVTYEFADDCSKRTGRLREADRCGPAPVGGKAANACGLYDVLGNVWEWCWDGYRPYYFDDGPPSVDPLGRSKEGTRVLRGGSWNSPAKNVRLASRTHQPQEHDANDLGFRVVRTVK